MTSAVPSRAHDHEPVAREDHLATAQLCRKLLGDEEALVHLPTRAVLEDPLLHLLVLAIGPSRRVADDQLGGDASSLGQEEQPFGSIEVSVEVSREYALEAVIPERQREGIARHESRERAAPAGDLEHSFALIEPDHLSRKVAGQETCPASDVEGVSERKRRQRSLERRQLPFPSGPFARAEQAATEVPVVVLRRSGVVVLAHRPRVKRMPFPLEAVPNFSEGRDRATIDAIAEALAAGAALFDVHSDSDHNRSVFTLAGSEQELISALLDGVAVARERIDLRRHEGVHPCVGVADVLPLVAIRPEDLERARAAALELGERIGSELWLPVFLYGELAAGRRLAELRRGGAKELSRRIERGELVPDFGPSRLDPRAGAALVGARSPLIAFNVNLRGSLEAAKEIAAVVRESGGGFAGVRALGLELPGAGLVQVSMNIEDWRASGLSELVACIEREADERGVEIAGSELVGLVPAGAALGVTAQALHLESLEEPRIIESRLVEEFGDGLGE